jgi:very-short-patch-repair endonuclease
MTKRPTTRDGKAQWQTVTPGLWQQLSQEARRMRGSPTPAERLLWAQLRRRALGVSFRRQQAIGRFIVDFCCLQARLVVEVDGPIHVEKAQSDAERDAFLAAEGFQVLRFSNDAVLHCLDDVIQSISKALAVPAPPGLCGD